MHGLGLFEILLNKKIPQIPGARSLRGSNFVHCA